MLYLRARCEEYVGITAVHIWVGWRSKLQDFFHINRVFQVDIRTAALRCTAVFWRNAAH